MSKNPPCCSRLEGNVTREKADLAAAARRYASAVERGHGIKPEIIDLVTNARRQVAEAKARLVEHEASHAGQAVA